MEYKSFWAYKEMGPVTGIFKTSFYTWKKEILKKTKGGGEKYNKLLIYGTCTSC